MPKTTPYPAVDLGPLPVEAINAVLGTELEDGHAWLSETAHMHMARDHAADYPVCIAHLAGTIAAPTFIGQDPSHGGNFVLVKRVLPDGRGVLAAVALEPNRQGNYKVRTAYLIPQRTIDTRRAAGRLKTPPPKKTEGPA